MNLEQITHLEQLEKQANYSKLINEIKQLLKLDPKAFSHPFIKRWCGVRWRNFLLSEAVADKVALKKADKSKLLGLKDKRPDKQKIAERYLRGDEIREWSLDLPKYKHPKKKLKTTLGW